VAVHLQHVKIGIENMLKSMLNDEKNQSETVNAYKAPSIKNN
jgi:hypothetical protein